MIDNRQTLIISAINIDVRRRVNKRITSIKMLNTLGKFGERDKVRAQVYRAAPQHTC